MKKRGGVLKLAGVVLWISVEVDILETAGEVLWISVEVDTLETAGEVVWISTEVKRCARIEASRCLRKEMVTGDSQDSRSRLVTPSKGLRRTFFFLIVILVQCLLESAKVCVPPNTYMLCISLFCFRVWIRGGNC